MDLIEIASSSSTTRQNISSLHVTLCRQCNRLCYIQINIGFLQYLKIVYAQRSNQIASCNVLFYLPVVPIFEKNLPESNSKSLSKSFSFLRICFVSGLYLILVENNLALLYYIRLKRLHISSIF